MSTMGLQRVSLLFFCLAGTGVLCVAGTGTGRKRVRWAQQDGGRPRMTSVSVGRGGVWALDEADRVYYKQDTYGNPTIVGSDWTMTDGSFKQLDVGQNFVLAVDRDDTVFYRAGISSDRPQGYDWVPYGGDRALSNVTVSPSGRVWGVDSRGDVYYRRGASNCDESLGDRWSKVGGQLVQVSAGFAGVWGINARQHVLYREETFGDHYEFPGTSWITVDGPSLTHISVGDGLVIGIGDTNKVYLRRGISHATPTGHEWVRSGKMRVVDVYSSNAWGVDGAGSVKVGEVTTASP